jgi:hypothetical protein
MSNTCPLCQADLTGAPIPVEDWEDFGGTHFSRAIAIYDQNRDRTTHYRCPDCGGEWER